VTERDDGPDVSWARTAPAGAVREALLFGVFGPLIDAYTRPEVIGQDQLDGVDPPVIFVANHSSHIDTPVILRALPREWRRRTAVAAAADYFYRVPLVAHAVTLAFNTVAVQREAGGVVPDAASQVERLIRDGWSLLVFAEGTRSRDGSVGRLRSGAAVLAAEQGLAIVPIYVSGTHEVMPPGSRWMRSGSGRLPGSRRRIAVRFGPPVEPGEDEHRTEVMERVRQFFEESGADTTLDKRIEARRRRAAS
jgi:1-acyl-sn-glycerol-3-phosphate acyltransferase